MESVSYQNLPINVRNAFEMNLGKECRSNFKAMGLTPREWQVREYIDKETENTIFFKTQSRYFKARVKRM